MEQVYLCGNGLCLLRKYILFSGRNLDSALFEDVCKVQDVKKVRTLLYLQFNGMIENCQSTLGQSFTDYSLRLELATAPIPVGIQIFMHETHTTT